MGTKTNPIILDSFRFTLWVISTVVTLLVGFASLHNWILKPSLLDAAREVVRQEVRYTEEGLNTLTTEVGVNYQQILHNRAAIADEVKERKDLEKRFNDFADRLARIEESVKRIEKVVVK